MRKEKPIKTSVKSGNFRPTKSGAGMTRKGVMAYSPFFFFIGFSVCCGKLFRANGITFSFLFWLHLLPLKYLF